MPINKRHLISKLIVARRKLKNAQIRVTDLEALLLEKQTNSLNLKESSHGNTRTLDNLIEGCQIIGFDWRYLYINDVTAQQGHQTKEALLGSTMMEKYPGIENTPLFTTLRRCMEECTVQHLENEFIYPDGTTGWFELS